MVFSGEYKQFSFLAAISAQLLLTNYFENLDSKPFFSKLLMIPADSLGDVVVQHT